MFSSACAQLLANSEAAQRSWLHEFFFDFNSLFLEQSPDAEVEFSERPGIHAPTHETTSPVLEHVNVTVIPPAPRFHRSNPRVCVSPIDLCKAWWRTHEKQRPPSLNRCCCWAAERRSLTWRATSMQKRSGNWLERSRLRTLSILSQTCSVLRMLQKYLFVRRTLEWSALLNGTSCSLVYVANSYLYFYQLFVCEDFTFYHRCSLGIKVCDSVVYPVSSFAFNTCSKDFDHVVNVITCSWRCALSLMPLVNFFQRNKQTLQFCCWAFMMLLVGHLCTSNVNVCPVCS